MIEKNSILKNKKGWIARDFVVALIIFAGVMGLMYLMVGDMGNNYGNPGIVDANFNAHYNNLKALGASTGTMLNTTRSPQGFTLLGNLGTIFSSMITVIGLVFDSITGVGTQVAYASTDLGVPTAVAGIIFPMIILIVTVIIIFVVIGSAKFGKL